MKPSQKNVKNQRTEASSITKRMIFDTKGEMDLKMNWTEIININNVLVMTIIKKD